MHSCTTSSKRSHQHGDSTLGCREVLKTLRLTRRCLLFPECLLYDRHYSQNFTWYDVDSDCQFDRI